MNATLHLRSTLASVLVAICMTLAATGTASAAQRSPTTSPTSHSTMGGHHPRIVAYADGSLTHRRHHRRHAVAYAA
jgi:hypothetical protein